MYNKLVRDKIQEKVEADGWSCETEILEDDKCLKMIDSKLDEYHKEQNLEELADILKVIHASARARGYFIEDLESFRVNKAKIFLKKVIE